jgi:hypothetical protein
MSIQLKTGATQTGGTTVTLVPAGVSAGRSAFVAPTHTRLEPKTIDFTSSISGNKGAAAGRAHSGMRINFADRESTEGCCTVNAGAVRINMGFDWDLSQPDTLVDDAVAYLRGAVFETWFVDLLKKGILPSG